MTATPPILPVTEGRAPRQPSHLWKWSYLLIAILVPVVVVLGIQMYWSAASAKHLTHADPSKLLMNQIPGQSTIVRWVLPDGSQRKLSTAFVGQNVEFIPQVEKTIGGEVSLRRAALSATEVSLPVTGWTSLGEVVWHSPGSKGKDLPTSVYATPQGRLGLGFGDRRYLSDLSVEDYRRISAAP